ncbi:alpha/beta fold hydrolase [Fervidibacillus halotolerans]|uniref:Alpha/beta hydrolase n=1 Tax=Fervidibacillus halotolerans TaxID=2980027 RepID=A0A9E8M0H6_9BACI|nr:alpha/beta hydrolase [Fervidibacillus halotolerans]WAA12964.1 alpha/beta hydrolase [Fervidibacillus halotolerans]
MDQLFKVELPNGETITYRKRDGGEKPLLLIHGNMTSSKHWDVLMEKADPSLHLIAIDLRGFGGSSYHRRIQSIKDFSDDVKLFVDQLGLKQFSLMGWSTGGAVAMQFVADYPGYVDRLILLASASTRGYPFFHTKEDGMPDFRKRLKTIEEIEADIGKTIPVQTAYDKKDRLFLKSMWNNVIYTKNQPDEKRYEQYIDDMLTQRNLADVYHALNIFNISNQSNGVTMGTNQAKDIDVPVLVLRGDRDLVVTKEMTEEIMEDLGENAKFVELVDCGHSPLIDDLNQLLRHVETFLQV